MVLALHACGIVNLTTAQRVFKDETRATNGENVSGKHEHGADNLLTIEAAAIGASEVTDFEAIIFGHDAQVFAACHSVSKWEPIVTWISAYNGARVEEHRETLPALFPLYAIEMYACRGHFIRGLLSGLYLR